MLTKTQKQYLKGLANTVRPLVMIGKNGLNENVIASIDEVLDAHELVKISVLNNCEIPASELAIDISVSCHCDIVSQLGRKITVYRKNLKEPVIRLPK
ncbi:MAG: YhbY family RNA-binding protein [Erysipelotrichaceae bacterium]|nr:YhbY family RNA-binding protein [Erysipelotrichaceae bacterium]MBQ4252473.1 YhbY family RNA-binding protein [Erysipelotrichaceae bacterium]MBQ7223539.1 YhbY family RNA-binding protein [Erysipelotrichaceae bacterium]